MCACGCCVCSGAHIGLLEKCRSYAIRLAVLCQAQIDGAAAASALIRTHHAKLIGSYRASPFWASSTVGRAPRMRSTSRRACCLAFA